jgi:periplasmic divalent cation tolerance protein
VRYSLARVKVVLCNAPPEEAEKIARALVEEKLAACVNLLPVQSVYRWEGELRTDREVTLVVKVSAAAVSALRDRLRQLHSYSIPEIVALEVDTQASLESYVEWVRGECVS